nr:hypothetical protein Iba_scaffold60341CG0010 [Ipomoea batatas]GMC94526.1 hypothetical protein Iba_chr05bCG12530 [Ipomoea batatas]GMC96423.1 hypothetical protein Iba_chr05cCG17940 [Ipomoea batatas]GMC98594.1 hypothetical protein Iba_chr05dCG18000 [Ipomoea batatas]GMD02327.1 hypothetical protein Iba_chr05fCG15570 [Ipomoea batatas]
MESDGSGEEVKPEIARRQSSPAAQSPVALRNGGGNRDWPHVRLEDAEK